MLRFAGPKVWLLALCLGVCAALVQPLTASVAGAIWTTLSDGTEVNGNIYQFKEDVYLNGGPGHGSGSNSPGLDPDGIYVFMVTDPSGKDLLSTDAAECREVQVTNGVFAGATGPCPHTNGSAAVGVPVQLMPYLDTTNNGGEYKVWLTPIGKYACPLNVVSCDTGTFGFIASESKTDNYKVKVPEFQEIDTLFIGPDNQWIEGQRVQWIDTHGASNNKWSYLSPFAAWLSPAHVEAVEAGLHYIVVEDQPGCLVGSVYVDGTPLKKLGPQTIPIRITQAMKNKGNFSVYVTVYCH